jgi:hypothetical protein
MTASRSLRRLLALTTLSFPLALALAGCGSSGTPERNLDTLDSELVDTNGSAPAKDPALMSALQQQIMVDPVLAQASNGDAVRPPNQPFAAPVPAETVAGGAPAATGPLKSAPAPSADCPNCTVAQNSMTLGALAAQQKNPRTADCVRGLSYAAGWANRLPSDLPLFPDARVTEAAGTDRNGCAMRAVSYSSPSSLQRVIDWYYTKALAGGYAPQHQADGGNHVVGGTRARDDGTFVVFLKARGDGGTDIDLVANNGI